MENKIKQTFCKHCGGMKTLKVNGKMIKQSEWIKYGFAIDIGCIC